MAASRELNAPVPKLSAAGLGMRFDVRGRTTEVLRDISLTVYDGEFVSIVGPSGCGKTTLLRTLHGLMAPSTGTVTVAGRVVTEPGTDRGFVFQQDGLYPWRTVLGNITFGLELQGTTRHTARERADEMIRMVGLEGFEHFYPHEISGGMRQRVNIARALAINPEVLLMDEPFAALDAHTREDMQHELLRIWEQARKTVIFITHQIDEAIYLSDRVVVLTARPGRTREVIPVELPRPRSLAVKRSIEFLHYMDWIWKLIERT